MHFLLIKKSSWGDTRGLLHQPVLKGGNCIKNETGGLNTDNHYTRDNTIIIFSSNQPVELEPNLILILF